MESHSYLDMLREPMCIHRSSVFSPELCDFFKLSLNQTYFIGVVRQFNEKYSKTLWRYSMKISNSIQLNVEYYEKIQNAKIGIWDMAIWLISLPFIKYLKYENFLRLRNLILRSVCNQNDFDACLIVNQFHTETYKWGSQVTNLPSMCMQFQL